MSKKFEDLAFIELVTPSIAPDRKIQGLALGAGQALGDVYSEVEVVYILSRIDALPEPVVDLLGWQFHVDFWDEDLPLDHKRELVKTSIEVHRYKGTPAAIERILEAIGYPAQVLEWFDYQGEPYYFRVDIDLDHKVLTPDLYTRFLELIYNYKNTRSWLDPINGVTPHYLLATSLSMSLGCTGQSEYHAPFSDLYETTAPGPLKVSLGNMAMITAYAPMG